MHGEHLPQRNEAVFNSLTENRRLPECSLVTLESLSTLWHSKVSVRS